MARTPELQRFYGTKAWQDLRMVRIMQEHGHCQRCGKDFSDDLSQLIAHHKEHLTPQTLSKPDIALNPDNVEIVCKKCHAYYHEDRGYIRPPRQVFIVYGAPMSGKSTYVAQNAVEGDLIVDLDRIFEAITPAPRYHHTEQVKGIAFGIRDYLYDQVRTRNGTWDTAWIIGGYPRKMERERLAARLGASLVLVECDKDECYKRLYACDDGRGLEWGEFIDDWFLNYQA